MSEPVTREPACGAPLCPRPTDPDFHACLVCGKREVEHAHVEGRGRNPARAKDKSNIVPLCVKHHREVDERQGGTHAHFLRQLPGKGLVYWRTDIHGAVMFECIIDPEAIRIIVPGAEEREHPAQVDGAGATLPARSGAKSRLPKGAAEPAECEHDWRCRKCGKKQDDD